MSREEQIEEMAVIVSNSIREWANDLPPISCPVYNAEALYNAGYRKQSEVERLQAQNSDLDILVKDLRFRNKELQKANEGLAKNIEELEIENDIVREAYLRFEETSGLKKSKAEVAREIFEEIERTCVDTLGCFYIGATHGAFAELKKKYTEVENERKAD